MPYGKKIQYKHNLNLAMKESMLPRATVHGNCDGRKRNVAILPSLEKFTL
jgi:hypothetical protein